jgi:ABC-2 type transport system ATP-binding protein
MIEFHEVCRSYGEKVAVDRLTLRVPTGELFAFLGHNGAGKTTAIRMIVGLLRPGSGTVRVGGYDVVTQTRQAAALLGYVPDEPYLYDKLSGREVLQFVARMYGMNEEQSRAAIDHEIDRFELSEFVDDLTETYSHGMKQRTVFASALLHSPQALVVDEPMVGLDPHSMRLVRDLLRAEATAGMSIFMSTHTLSAAEQIADRIGIMREGKLVFVGTVAELRKQLDIGHGSLEAMYLALTETAATDRPSGAAPFV